MERIDRALGEVKPWVDRSTYVLLSFAMITFSCATSCIIILCKWSTQTQKYIFPLLALILLLHVWYASKRKPLRNHAPQPRNPRVIALRKVVLQSFVLAFFTFLDSWLKESNRSLTLVLCISVYTYLVTAMAFFRVQEDFDLVGGFLAAGFNLFYEISTDWWEKGVLLIVVILLGSLKALVV